MKRTKKGVRAKKAKHFKIPNVTLRNSVVRDRPQLHTNDENDEFVRSIRQAAQALHHVVPQQNVQPLNQNDAQEAFIRALQEAARNLHPVDGYRTENGVIIID